MSKKNLAIYDDESFFNNYIDLRTDVLRCYLW